uniref:Metalloendopeptidase n=1 Tax=Meloidogyne enterolobii TaxID=390850 RepID=A0A6V7YB20_MELEN|nr:unnamed protein product [Meloidogyne enterolobii]
MLQPLLIFIILALLVSINFVTGGTLRSKSGSERNSWITEDAITEDESTDYEEELTLSDLFSDNDFEFVGDMIIEKKNVEVESSEEEGVQKSVVKNMSRIWPNNQVPIKFHSSLGRKARKSIQSAVNILEDATCISFPKYNPNRHKNYVIIKSIKKACKSTVGYVDKPGRNIINLESKTHCEEPNTVIHEIMHCLGVSHEQMRYDRDEYIEVLYDNLESDAVSQYAKQSRKDFGDLRGTL